MGGTLFLCSNVFVLLIRYRSKACYASCMSHEPDRNPHQHKRGGPIAAFFSLVSYLDQREWSTLVGTGSLLWIAAIVLFTTASAHLEPIQIVGTLYTMGEAVRRNAIWESIQLVAIPFASAGSALIAFAVYRTIRNLMHQR